MANNVAKAMAEIGQKFRAEDPGNGSHWFAFLVTVRDEEKTLEIFPGGACRER